MLTQQSGANVAKLFWQPCVSLRVFGIMVECSEVEIEGGVDVRAAQGTFLGVRLTLFLDLIMGDEYS